MKTKILSIASAIILFFSGNMMAKDTLTKASFKVSGNCDMCKERIEKAAKSAGVKHADWSEDTHILTVSFAVEKTNLEKIQQNVANAGYDNEKFKATEEAYKKLPKCCQYDK
ncbi:MAG: cation transporter [Chitinophagales bacterium]|nr:cation transporter [Chitinophagales bacterium]HMV14424.1 heavy-metal-associated domain-containing protein [Chitinophagales bacterium]HMW12441.1 heavy-metal-associated domain-containing protein [Chitinophagales bacterium]HMX59752.1 heavy-metal-associated domain-containing protein [Chitinophagales bacterium]HMY22559.1 heavy-metal-associated domain-containing protein [Chitinophagales bacterium]